MQNVSGHLAASLRLACLLAAIAVVVCAGVACASRPMAQEVSALVPRAAPQLPPRPARADVDLLQSASFEDRSHAAERLVAMGEDALPVLGATGEGSVRVYGTEAVATTRPVVRAILEDLPQARLYVHLDAAWPIVRREAAEELGRRGRLGAVPHLLPRMDDEDRGVRGAAVSSLRRLTNQFFGYDARAHLSARRSAVHKWREWWAIEGRVRAERDRGVGAG